KYPIPTDSRGDNGPATAAHLNGPRGIAADAAGDIYVAEEGGARIRRIDPSGIITTIAGNGQANPDGHNPKVAGDPGPAPAMEAQFNTIHDLNLDKDGNLWIADSKNNRVRVVFDPAHAPAGTPAGAGSSGAAPGATTSTTAAASTTPTTAAKAEPTTSTTAAASTPPHTDP